MTLLSRIGPAPTAPLFSASGIVKSYGVVRVLDGVSFDVPANAVVSFVGENGAGKSTLLNILSGLVRPDAGRMELLGETYAPQRHREAVRRGVSRVFQEQALIATAPVYENLLLGEERRFSRAGQWLDRKAMIRAAQDLVDDAGLVLDVRRRTDSYSFSTRQSIEIVRACLAGVALGGVERPFVLLDEPTSVLDQRDEKIFFDLVQRMRRRGSLLFVSHRLSEVRALSDLIYVLKDGKLVARLPASEAVESRLHELMVGRDQAADYYHQSRQRRDLAQQPAALLATDLAQPGVYAPIGLVVRRGEVLGVGGLLDSGKSELGAGVAGVKPPAQGSVAIGSGAPVAPRIRRLARQGLGYVPAERLADGLIARFSVAWNLSLASADLFSNRLGFWRSRKERSVARDYIRRLAIRSATPGLRCQRLSGGNQQKVVLARWLARQTDVLVLDNPTRGVDAGAREQIYGVIRDLTDRGVAVLLITDELPELIGLSDRILVLQQGRAVREFPASPDAKPTERELVASMMPAGASADPTPPVRAEPFERAAS